MVGMHLIMVDAALFMVQVTGAEEKKNEGSQLNEFNANFLV